MKAVRARPKPEDIHMHMHTQEAMAKTIAVANDVYEMLAKDKRNGESFSDVLRRWRRSKPSLMDSFGVWGDIPEAEFRRIKRVIDSVDRPISEELAWRKRAR